MKENGDLENKEECCGTESSVLTDTEPRRAVIESTGDFDIVDGMIVYYRGKKSELTIPDTVKGIADHVFKNNTEIVSVSFGKGIETIGEEAFYGCNKLATVYFGDGLKRIGKDAFCGCRAIETVSLPSAVVWCGTKLCNEYSNPCCYAKVVNIPNSDNGKVLRIPSAVKRVPSLAYRNIKTIETLYISDGVLEIGEGAFSGCESIRRVSFGNTLERIGNSAFSGCKGLECVLLPDSVTEVGEQAFYNTSLKALRLSNCLRVIGKSAFSGCRRLEYVLLPDSVTEVGEEAFYNTPLKELKLSNCLRVIGSYAFYHYCGCLEQITVPKSVEYIGKFALRCGRVELEHKKWSYKGKPVPEKKLSDPVVLARRLLGLKDVGNLCKAPLIKIEDK